jgi:hypothetical protein
MKARRKYAKVQGLKAYELHPFASYFQVGALQERWQNPHSCPWRCWHYAGALTFGDMTQPWQLGTCDSVCRVRQLISHPLIIYELVDN